MEEGGWMTMEERQGEVGRGGDSEDWEEKRGWRRKKRMKAERRNLGLIDRSQTLPLHDRN